MAEALTGLSWLSPRSRLTSVSLFSSPKTPETDLLTDANVGVDEIVEEQRPFPLKHGVSFGDLYVHFIPLHALNATHPHAKQHSIQFAGAVAVSNCAGGPRLQYLAGRSNISQPSP